jgi:uncharacterized protein
VGLLLHINYQLAGAGLVIGFLVGLTGMGGGALSTPILILFFRVQPAIAVGSDLIASVVMKVFGAGVHLRQRTVRWELVRWLCMGSIPGALAAAALLLVIGPHSADGLLLKAIGISLIAAAVSTAVRGFWRAPDSPRPPRRGIVVAVGAVAGFMVGLTSVGSGSLVLACLVLLVPGISSSELVGTDLMQGLILVTVAATAHLSLGTVSWPTVGGLLLGAIPGVLAGAHLSAHSPDKALRPALALVLLSTGLKLL